MHCLRCGKEIADSATFCDSCEKAVSEPLEESAYLSKQIQLPVRKPQQPQTKTARKTGRKPEEEETKPRRKGVIVFFAVLCMLLLAAGMYLTTRFLDSRNEAAALKEQVAALEEDKAGLERTNAGLRDTVDGLENAVSALEDTVGELEKTVDGLAKTKTGLEQTLDFVDSRTAFVSNDGSPVYHTADCEKLDKENFTVYDVNAAKARGFTPCPDCRPDE